MHYPDGKGDGSAQRYFQEYRVDCFDPIIGPWPSSQTVTNVTLCGKVNQNGAGLPGSQIHVSVSILVFVKKSYYNEPWLDSPF